MGNEQPINNWRKKMKNPQMTNLGHGRIDWNKNFDKHWFGDILGVVIIRAQSICTRSEQPSDRYDSTGKHWKDVYKSAEGESTSPEQIPGSLRFLYKLDPDTQYPSPAILFPIRRVSTTSPPTLFHVTQTWVPKYDTRRFRKEEGQKLALSLLVKRKRTRPVECTSQWSGILAYSII